MSLQSAKFGGASKIFASREQVREFRRNMRMFKGAAVAAKIPSGRSLSRTALRSLGKIVEGISLSEDDVAALKILQTCQKIGFFVKNGGTEKTMPLRLRRAMADPAMQWFIWRLRHPEATPAQRLGYALRGYRIDG